MTREEQQAYDEALRRIEECRQSKRIKLEVSGLGLTRLPEEIGQLSWLRTLDASGNQLTSLPERRSVDSRA